MKLTARTVGGENVRRQLAKLGQSPRRALDLLAEDVESYVEREAGKHSKSGALFASIPGPVVGGMYCAMFGMIVAVGLSNLQFVNLNSTRNLFIIGFSFFMGLSIPEYFRQNPLKLSEDWTWFANIVNTLGSTSMAVGAVLALILDNTISGTDEERGLTHWKQLGG